MMNRGTSDDKWDRRRTAQKLIVGVSGSQSFR